jgi:hypothetical protein
VLKITICSNGDVANSEEELYTLAAQKLKLK